MIARRHILALEQKIAPGRGVGANDRLVRPLAIFAPVQGVRLCGESARHVETQAGAAPGRTPNSALGFGHRAAGSRIKRRAVGILGETGGAGNFAARAKTGIDEAARAQSVERARIIAGMLALATRRLGESHAEPGEVDDDGPFILALAAGAIDVFDAQEKAPAACRGHLRIEQRGIGVAEMQEAVRRRGEAKDRLDQGSVHFRICAKALACQNRPLTADRAKRGDP